jgi:hypothetical protein
VQRLLSGYLFAVDTAVREYRDGRTTLVRYSRSANQTLILIEGLGRFENCINAVARSLKFLMALSAYPESPTIDRTLRRLIASLEESISSVRNSIEHIESDIASTALMPEGAAHMLAINHGGDTLEIPVHTITFRSLASTISKLYSAGGQMIDALPAPQAKEDEISAMHFAHLLDIG